MRLSKKQQAIVDIVQTGGILEKHNIFDSLEGEIEDKKTYRSRYNSFAQTLKKLVEKGALEWQGESLAIASALTQKKLKSTESTLKALSQLRDRQQALTLANLKNWMDVHDWVWSLVQWKLSLSSEESRIIDLDAPLDDNPENIEALLNILQVDVPKIMDSGLIFGTIHLQQLEKETHRFFCDKILKYSIPHQTLKVAIQSKLIFQSSSKTIAELLEPVVQLSEEELQEIAKKFEGTYLQEAATRFLLKILQAQKPFEVQLQLRFPGFFKGSWEWDRLYQQLNQKITNHAKANGLFQSPEEWKQILKKQSRHRFQQAQQSQSRSSQNSQSQNTFRKNTSQTLESCYQLLGLTQSTSVEEIKVAFRKLAKAHHPDQGGNPEFFRSLSHAYTRLISHLEN
ncbi:MAG: DnaJ domain-containing protein [SAR324 cluster bacterium]|nr:DnaJ domain-containing protein [SAR324 cluster bacterium]